MNKYSIICIIMQVLCVTMIEADCRAKCKWGDDEPVGVVIGGKCICGHEFNNPVRLGRGIGHAIGEEKKRYVYE